MNNRGRESAYVSRCRDRIRSWVWQDPFRASLRGHRYAAELIGPLLVIPGGLYVVSLCHQVADQLQKVRNALLT